MDRFYDETYNNESLVKHPSSYTPKPSDPEVSKILATIENIDPTASLDRYDNITYSERIALKEIEDLIRTDLIIKKADKGNTFVVMDSSYYRDKLVIADHLDSDTYKKADSKADEFVMAKLRALMEKHSNCLTEDEFDYITDFNWKTSNLYVLPKIHKSRIIIDTIKETDSPYLHIPIPSDLKGRPVIAGPAAPTQHLSELLEKILSPLVPYQRSYVKDDWDFLRKFPRVLPLDNDLYTCDIVSLYTNISHELGMDALRYWTQKLRSVIPSRFTTEFILDCTNFILSNNYFIFDSVMYLQLVGTAIGTIFAPPYACLSVGYLEETKLYPVLRSTFEPDISEFIINIFMRYMDDGIVSLPASMDISEFSRILNDLDPRLNRTSSRNTR